MIRLLFSSVEFLFLFLPATGLLFWAARRWLGGSIALGLLTLSSIVFYSVWNPAFVPIFLCSVFVNYWLSQKIEGRNPRTTRLLAVGILANLGLLFHYKYAASATRLLTDFGWLDAPMPEKLLPLGISFYTFTQLTYLVDRWQGKATRSTFLNYVLFVSFFPHLIAGPIVHHSVMMPQLLQLRPTWKLLGQGMLLLAIGFAKKVLIADPLGQHVDPGFRDVNGLATVNSWYLLGCYHFQIYFDFSGYSDMAIGLGKMFGIEFPKNFDSPFKASNLIEVWRRWHMTLTRFLRDYVYVPLGGSNGGGGKYLNVFATMLVSGVWHGAGFKFFFFGLLHGIGLVINHRWQDAGFKMPRLLGWALTMGFWFVCLPLFRGRDLNDAITLYGKMLGRASQTYVQDFSLVQTAPYLGAAAFITFLLPNSGWFAERFRPSPLQALFVAALMSSGMIYVLGQYAAPQFLYFDF